MKKGLDAPLVPIIFTACGLVGMIPAWNSHQLYNFLFPVLMLVLAAIFVHTSYRGKYAIIRQTVAALKIPQNSQVLDLGTGHGAVLLAVAGKLQRPGKVVGIDLWKSADQSSNSLAATQQNIEAAGVSDVAEIKTADMTKLPFDDESFDYVFASLAIHNVKPRAQRERALREALRVLKPAGYLVIIDLEHVGEFKRYLNEQNCRQVSVKRAGFNGLWGWLPTRILIAEK